MKLDINDACVFFTGEDYKPTRKSTIPQQSEQDFFTEHDVIGVPDYTYDHELARKSERLSDEKGLQKLAVSLCRTSFPDVIISNFLYNTQTAWQGADNTQMGYHKGISDVILIYRHKVFFVEFKTPKGKQSPEQAIFQKKIEEYGFSYFLCKNIDTFHNILKKITE